MVSNGAVKPNFASAARPTPAAPAKVAATTKA
jgi:hypothetical protein